MTNWKTDENGSIVLKDGNPVYVDSSNNERTVSVDAIRTLNQEAMSARQIKEGLELKLKAFDGINADEARKALDTVAKIGKDGGAVPADKIDEIKATMSKQYGEDMAQKDKLYNELKLKHESLLVENAFAKSDFIKNGIAVPADMFLATFKDNLKIEDGELRVYDKNGQRFQSKNFGEYASVEEGLRMLAESHPSKDVILKANVPSGSGSNGSGSGGITGRVITRSEFDALPPLKQAELAGKVRNGELKLV